MSWNKTAIIATCTVQQLKKVKIIFVGHAITSNYITLCSLYRALHNNTYTYYTCLFNDNTLSTTVPVLWRQILPEINPLQLELILQHLKLIALNPLAYYFL